MEIFGNDAGHLFGEAIFNADFWVLQNTDGDEIIRYTKHDGLSIAGGSGYSGRAELEWVEYDATTYAEITAILEKGKIPVLKHKINANTDLIYFYNGKLLGQNYQFISGAEVFGGGGLFFCTVTNTDVWSTVTIPLVSMDDVDMAIQGAIGDAIGGEY